MSLVKQCLIATTLLLLGTIFASTPLSASTNRFDLLYLRPVPDGGYFFTVFDSRSLSQFKLNIGTALDYAHRPLTGLSGVTPVNITSDYLAGYLFAAFGIIDQLSVYANMPYLAYNRSTNPDTAPFPPAKNYTKIGDLEFGFKWHILGQDDAPLGLALVPFMTVPTGSEGTFMGNDGVTGGARFVVDGAATSWFRWSLNIGGVARKHVQAFGLDFKDQFLLSGAVRFKLASWAYAIGEASSTTPFAHFYEQKSTSPINTLFGMQWRIPSCEGLIINTSAGFGEPYGSGAPQWRTMASVSYAFGPLGKHRAEAAPSEVTTPALTPFAILFGTNSATLSPASQRNLDAVAQQLQSHPQKIIITGYTDSRGSKVYNQKLSAQRAKAVAWYLQHHNVVKKDMRVRGRGEAHPAASNATAKGRAQNRRVVIRPNP